MRGQSPVPPLTDREIRDGFAGANVLPPILSLGEAASLVKRLGENVTAPQITYAALQIKAIQGFDIDPPPKGRPSDVKRNVTLKELPSAKALAREFGASDRMIRLTQRAMAYPRELGSTPLAAPAATLKVALHETVRLISSV